MTAGNRRVLRMICKVLLLISLPLAGFVWALPENPTMLVAAGVLSVLSLAVGFGAEYLASATENDLNELSERIDLESQRRSAALEERDERLRQFDRMVTLLTSQNHDLRGRLVALQVDLQNKRDELLHAAGKAVAMDEGIVETMSPAFSARAH